MVTNERETRQKKVAAALLLLQQQEAALINEFIPSAIPNTDLIIIKREHYDVFMRTVNYAVEHHQTKNSTILSRMHPIGILLCVLVSIGYCTDIVVNVAFYCPKNKTWKYDIKGYGDGFPYSPNYLLDCDHKSHSSDTTFTFKCEAADLFFRPAFVAWNLGTNDHAAAYEKLLVPYMKEECWKYGDTICTEYVTSTTKTTSTSTTESSNLVPIIIGASVATIVLIGGLICFLKCRQGKKNKVLDPYGKTNGLSWHTLCVSHDLYLSAISLHRVSTRGTCIVNSDEERGRDTPPDVILFTSSALADSERSCYLAPLTLNKR
ncbi:Protein CBG18575 [Caenorhabditis briggsae]|uniref:Protein CBG18575 n=1 Tax=Caenorhabditis briggsae TaxID=6238 RepID=A8XTM1_CAEBR|nr:Protein CBG18575 [Caenorhabditis briggsae]CAP35997.2 Protein CBG18575 [Caenorhabditis briggsae]